MISEHWKTQPRDERGRWTDEQGFFRTNTSYADIIKSTTLEEGEKKKPITQITDEAIESVPKVCVDGFTDEQNTFVQNQHKQLLRYAKDNNGSKEVAFVFRKDLSDKTVVVGNDDGVELGYGLTGKGDNLFIMHNHPRNCGYSDTDIVDFIRDGDLKHLSIVKNNGEIEIISKLSSFSKKRMIAQFRRQYKNYVKTGADAEISKAVNKLLEKSTEDLLWIKSK